MRADWVRRKLQIPVGIDRVIIPGWCGGELDSLTQHFGVPFIRGPKDLFDLPVFFGQLKQPQPDLSQYSIEILAEINHTPRLTWEDLLRQSTWYRQCGADVIDLGCIPGETWQGVGDAVRRLTCEGFRVSIDSFNREEVESAVEAGAELVLSCNQTNVEWLSQLPVEVVVIPDDPHDLGSWNGTLTSLEPIRQPFRLDPILEPIGFGFAASLSRYYETRRQFPQSEIMMGIGNLTELTEVDSAGVNFMLAAICEELQISSVLATEVINWGRTAVREFDLARRLVRHSVARQMLPKNLGGQLVMLRDPRLHELGDEGLKQLASRVTDPNFRIFAEREEIHLINRDGYWHGSDPYEVFDNMIATVGQLTSEHAFYIGMELCKARTALTLGKQYTQDEALRWGFLTVEEISAVERRRRDSKQSSESQAPAES
jgi:dihydropteroate synthase-like protein